MARQWPFLSVAYPDVDADSAVRFLCEDMNGAAGLFCQTIGPSQWLAGLCKLDWDSNHFSMPVAEIRPLMNNGKQLTPESLAAGQSLTQRLIREADKRGIAHLSTTVYAGDTPTQLCLEKAGFFMADTLVTHTLRLEKCSPQVSSPAIRDALESDREQLAKISADCFSNREFNINRFNSDMTFSPDRVRELYRLWLLNSISGALADRVLVFVEAGQPLGFITIKMPSAKDKSRGRSIAHIPLNAVHPEHRGRGIYKQLVAAAISELRGTVAQVDIKTQLPNYAVHKTWSALGARITQVVHRFHLPLLSKSRDLERE